MQIAVPMPTWIISNPVRTIREFYAEQLAYFMWNFQMSMYVVWRWLTAFQSFICQHILRC